MTKESGWSDMDFYKANKAGNPQYGYFAGCEFPIINAEKGLLTLRAVRKRAYPERGDARLTVRILQAGERVNVVPAVCTCKISGNPPKRSGR